MTGKSSYPRFFHWLRVAAIGRRPKRTLLRVAVLTALMVVIFKFILIPVRVTGMSMEPTYLDGSVNFINRLAYLRAVPRRGDVVGIRLAGEHAMLLKRIVGLPGENISFAHGHVCVNGEVLPEPYLRLVSEWDVPGEKLGPEEYFFVGDNRSMAPQEHVHGITGGWRIAGKVLLPGRH